MNEHVHPIFANILRSIEQQPLQLHRAAAKAGQRRFTGEAITGFGSIDEESFESVICGECSGSGEGLHDGSTCRHCGGSGEVMEMVSDDNDADVRRERIEGGE